MWKSIRRWWSYLGAKLGMQLEATADPKVQLEQAIAEAREQHRLLTEQAANVIANESELQARLDRSIDELQKANASAGQALMLADSARRAGNVADTGRYEGAAEAFANRIITLERDIDGLMQAVLAAAQASARAREAVSQNSAAVQKRLAERERLLSQLDQAKMQEQMNAAMRQLSAVAGDETPTLEEVRAKIEHRLASAQATAQLSGGTVDSAMLDVERAQQQVEAQARLGDIRTRLGLPDPAEPAPAEIKVSPVEQRGLGPGGG